jgi:hypothetical protein
MEKLNDWREPVLKFQQLYLGQKNAPASQVLLFNPASLPNNEQQGFFWGLQCLNNAYRQQVSKHYNKIVCNITVAAFAIWWITHVSLSNLSSNSEVRSLSLQSPLDFPCNTAGLFNFLDE